MSAIRKIVEIEKILLERMRRIENCGCAGRDMEDIERDTPKNAWSAGYDDGAYELICELQQVMEEG